MIADLRFHHIGLACRDIAAEAQALGVLGYRAEGDVFEDSAQGIMGRFYNGPGPRMELLAALPGSTVLEPYLRSAARMYHQAFEVDEMQDAIAGLLSDRARLIRAPIPAVAFGGREIAFVMLRNMLMVELIQAPTVHDD